MKRLVNTYILVLGTLIFLGSLNSSQGQVWTLQQCIDSALVHHKPRQISMNNIQVAREKEKEVRSNLNPKISAQADYKYFMDLPTQLMPMNIFNPQIPAGQFREAQFGVPHNINANIQWVVPVYNPQIYGGIQVSKSASELAEIQLMKTEDQLIYDISISYFNAQVLTLQMLFVDSNLINTFRLLQHMEGLRSQMLAKGTDVSKVKWQYDQLSTQKEVLQNKYIQIIHFLQFQIGISQQEHFQINTQIAFQAIQNFPSNSVAEVKMLKARSKLLSQELTLLNHSMYYPSVNVYGSLGTAGYGYDKNPNQFLKFYPVHFAGLQVSYPIFQGLTNVHKKNQKKLELINNDLQLQVLADQNALQLNHVEAQKNVYLKSLVNYQSQIKLAETIYNQVLAQHKEGTAGITDILLADNSLREAQQHYLLAIIEYYKADLEYKKLSGNLKFKP